MPEPVITVDNLGKTYWLDAVTSAIEGFSHFHLDTNADGSVASTDSLYMEAVR